MTTIVNGTSGITFSDSSVQNTAAIGFRNRIINGAMVIDQRNAGASVTPTNGQYLVDRWFGYQNVASKYSAQQVATAPAGFINSLKATSLSAYSLGATDVFTLSQAIEGFNIADLAWGTASASSVTLSFRVYSSLTGTFGGSVVNGGFARSYPFTYSIPVANTWTTVSVTIAGDTTGTWATNNTVGMYVFFGLGVGSTYSAAAGAWTGSAAYSATGATSVVGTNGATFYITGVQLEKGTTASSFDFRSYGQELALCQRYFISYGGSAAYERFGTCICQSTTVAIAQTPLPVEMRSAPTFGYSSLANLAIYTGGAVIQATSIGGDSPSTKVGMVQVVVAAGLVATSTYQFLANNTTSARITWSAEL